MESVGHVIKLEFILHSYPENLCFVIIFISGCEALPDYFLANTKGVQYIAG